MSSQPGLCAGRRELGGAQQVKLTNLPGPAERAAAVSAFDARFGEMEQVLWSLSVHSLPALLAGESSPALEALVWTVKSWWGVQGVRSENKGPDGRGTGRVGDLDAGSVRPCAEYGPDRAAFACEQVAGVVGRSMLLGVPRREYSLASKVLHWLMPWRVPVYDSFVRSALGVPTSWDHPEAYRKVSGRDLRPGPRDDGGRCLDRLLQPASPLRTLDKLTWWLGGGSTGTAAQVSDPWQVISKLGLRLP